MAFNISLSIHSHIKGDSAGITSVHFINKNLGMITGGDLMITDDYTDNVAYSQDGGKTWTLNTHQPVTKGFNIVLYG